MKKSYQLEINAPPKMKWEEYRLDILAGWNSLLSDPCCTEILVQRFLEKHPSLLPCPLGRPLTQGGHNPFSSSVLTQPELPGLKCKLPDFMFFCGNSAEINAIFIEIESPMKKWVTKAGQQTSELTQAAHQLVEWKTWFSNPLNMAQFEKEYHVRDYGSLNDRQFNQHYVLIIGRSNEFTSASTKSQRSHMQRQNETWMTYDRLTPDPNFEDAVTIKLDRSGIDSAFRVAHVPATFVLGPHQYPDYHELIGLEEAIRANNSISIKRQDFLINRLPYWRKWLNSVHGSLYVTDGADFVGE